MIAPLPEIPGLSAHSAVTPRKRGLDVMLLGILAPRF